MSFIGRRTRLELVLLVLVAPWGDQVEVELIDHPHFYARDPRPDLDVNALLLRPVGYGVHPVDPVLLQRRVDHVTGPRTENTSFNAGRVSPQSGSSAAVAA